jgi:hypothetical protein
VFCELRGIDMVWGVGSFLTVLAGLGILAVTEALAMHRWEARMFRGGVRVYYRRASVDRDVKELALPSTRAGFFRPSVKARRLTPHEVAFVAPVLTACMMRGLLRFNSGTRSLESVGYLHWRSWAVFGWGFLLLFGAKGVIPIVVLAAYGYLGERARFTEVLEEARDLAA